MVVSETAPCDFRNLISDQIITPNTTMPMRDADVEDQHVQAVDLAADVRDTLRHVEQVPAGFGVGRGERAAMAARETSAFRIIVPVPAGRRHVHDALSFSNSNSFRPLAWYACLRALAAQASEGDSFMRPMRRWQSLRKSAPLLLRQKAPNLALPAL